MEQARLFLMFLSLVGLASLSISSIGAESERKWMTSACYKFNLTVWDKFSDQKYLAKYTVESSKGRVFIAQKNAIDHNSAMVVFPDDFHDAKAPTISAPVDCFDVEKYTWKIYVNDVVKDSGTFGFTRN